jgi:hypothetical protein
MRSTFLVRDRPALRRIDDDPDRFAAVEQTALAENAAHLRDGDLGIEPVDLEPRPDDLGQFRLILVVIDFGPDRFNQSGVFVADRWSLDERPVRPISIHSSPPPANRRN